MSKKTILYIVSLLAGAALSLAFAPFSFPLLAILSPAVLLFIWRKCSSSAKESFVTGWFFGCGLFAVGASWIYVSIYNYGNAPAALAFIITALFVAVLALFVALTGYGLQKIYPRNDLVKNLLVFPAIWVLGEWLRTWILTGFPWLFIGYSQISTPLKNIAPFLGVYGVSFAVVLISGLWISLLTAKKLSCKFCLLLGVVLIWFGSVGLGCLHFTAPQGKPIKVSLVQGNIPIEMKWDEKRTQNILNNYFKMSAEHWQSRIIVWPEAAMPVMQSQIPDFLKKLGNAAKRHGVTVVSGVVFQPFTEDAYYNSMLAVGTESGNYFKKHLVPFGEFLPFKPILAWLLNYWHMPWASFSAGPIKQPDFILANLVVAPFICYEIAYPELALQYLPRAQLLLTISEDGWFGHSIAAAQQLEISRMRSLETGRYQLVCANSGITAIIQPDGGIAEKAMAFQQTVLTGEVYAYVGATPWVQYGHYLWLILMGLCLLISQLISREVKGMKE